VQKAKKAKKVPKAKKRKKMVHLLDDSYESEAGAPQIRTLALSYWLTCR